MSNKGLYFDETNFNAIDGSMEINIYTTEADSLVVDISNLGSAEELGLVLNKAQCTALYQYLGQFIKNDNTNAIAIDNFVDDGSTRQLPTSNLF